MTLHLSLPGAHRSSQQQEELREARRVLKEKIRNDWEYPTLPAWRSSGAERQTRTGKDGIDEEEKIAGFRFHAPSDPAHAASERVHMLGLDFDPTEWREREEASETEGEASATSTSTTTRTSSSSKRRSKDSNSNSNAYQFEGPDSVAAQLQERRSARKRKRNEALREEMQWNKGLELFVNRRDEWCCARPAAEVRLAERKSSAAERRVPAVAATETGSTSSSPRSSTSSTPPQTTTSTPGTSPSATPDSLTVAPPSTISPDLDILIPLAPSLLPTHPIRRKISQNMYPEIYSKVILQSRTPSVPINLSNLVKALVQGWKDDGEWPPKAGPVEPSLGKKKGGEGGGIRHGIKKVLRVTGVVAEGKKDGKS